MLIKIKSVDSDKSADKGVVRLQGVSVRKPILALTKKASFKIRLNKVRKL